MTWPNILRIKMWPFSWEGCPKPLPEGHIVWLTSVYELSSQSQAERQVNFAPAQSYALAEASDLTALMEPLPCAVAFGTGMLLFPLNAWYW